MCFYHEFRYHCQHRTQWEFAEFCGNVRRGQRPQDCKIHFPTGVILPHIHGRACGLCQAGLPTIQRCDVQQFQNSGSEPQNLPIDPRLTSLAGEKRYNWHGEHTHLRLSGRRGEIAGTVGLNFDQGAGRDTFAPSQFGCQVMGEPGGGGAISYHPQSFQQSSNNFFLPQPSQLQQSSNKPQMPNNHPPPLPLPSDSFQQKPSNIRKYEMALQGMPQESSKRRRVSSSTMQSSAATLAPSLRHRETYLNLQGPPPPQASTPKRSGSRPMANSSPFLDGSTSTINHKSSTDQNTPEYDYSRDDLARKRAASTDQKLQHLAILENLIKTRDSVAPVLGLDDSRELFQGTLAQSIQAYRSEMSKHQAHSKKLLKKLKDHRLLGDIPFWAGAAEKLREVEGRGEDSVRENEGRAGNMGKDFVPWDENKTWIWEEGGHGFAGTYLDKNGEAPL